MPGPAGSSRGCMPVCGSTARDPHLFPWPASLPATWISRLSPTMTTQRTPSGATTLRFVCPQPQSASQSFQVDETQLGPTRLGCSTSSFWRCDSAHSALAAAAAAAREQTFWGWGQSSTGSILQQRRATLAGGEAQLSMREANVTATVSSLASRGSASASAVTRSGMVRRCGVSQVLW
jgi:hypothetical protein